MAKPFVTFPDPTVETLRILRGPFLADPEVAATNATVSRTMPERTADTVEPSVLVADDGDAGLDLRPVEAGALMRVSVWDASPARARRLAVLALAYLLAHSGDTKVRGFRDPREPFSTTDPDDGTPVSSFTITVRLRAE